ncbi:MAG: SUMF1/EgtB/PvdO family nonheme iron enzyme [Candidatus Stygibacter australis]|nr:SUMF1/EgtB/PvdO family nonheme iron enzyme [Candidatus Stygibacter australis]
MKAILYIVVIILSVLILSCTEQPTRDNPFDPGFDLPEPEISGLDDISLTSKLLSWDYDLDNIEGFMINRRDDSDWQEEVMVAPDARTWLDTAAAVNKHIQYKIKAVAGENESEFVNSVILDNMIPAPTNFCVAQVNVHCYDLSWEQDHIVGEDGFILERKVEDGEYIQIAVLGDNIESYQDEWEGKREENIVYYRIKTYVDEEYSSIVFTNNQILQAPSNLSYEKLAINRIALFWEDNTEGEQGFKIDKKVANNQWSENYTITTGNSIYWVDENAEINQDLQYRVYAYYGDIASTSIQTDIIDNNIQIPENLSIEIINDNEIRLNWEYELEEITGFRIEKKAEGGTWELYADNIATDLREWEDDNCHNNDSYRIKAYYQEYESHASNEVKFMENYMVFVEGGTFEMGDHYNEGNSDEIPLHDVTLSSFFIGQYEVTQDEYEGLMGSNPAHDHGVGDDYPVYYVSWYDAAEYCNALSEQKGLTPCYNLNDWSCNFSADGFRMPTEAEWEYAARGGVNWTDNLRYSGTTDNLGDHAWIYLNSDYRSHEIGTREANQLGIYDMSGNVWEWCNDWYSYYNSSPETDPLGPDNGLNRVNRGGSWSSYASVCRVANRGINSPGYSYNNIGFRLACGSN